MTVITPANGDLGQKTGRDLFNYSVTPANGQTITRIDEVVSGQVVNTVTNPAQLSRTFSLSQTVFDGVKYWAQTTLELRVTASTGSVTTRTYTFTKTLPSTGSLLEGVKANKDAADRMQSQLSLIGAEVGLSGSPGTNAILSALKGGAVRKFAMGQAAPVYDANGPIYVTNGVRFYIRANVGFPPRTVITLDEKGRLCSMFSVEVPYVEMSLFEGDQRRWRYREFLWDNGIVSSKDVAYNGQPDPTPMTEINGNSFSLPTRNNIGSLESQAEGPINTKIYTWIAIG